jgi:ParB family chromosome partitioning protein
MPKRAGREKEGSTAKSAKPKSSRAPDGISVQAKIEEVLLSDLDPVDARFQLRVDRDAIADLVRSLSEDGQQVPVVLWGKQKPYIVIDGHRRSKAAAKLEWSSVKAIIRHDLTEAEAYHLAYLENARRKSLTKLDQAHALWQLVNRRGMTIEAAGQSLGIKKDKAGRLVKLLTLPEELQDAVKRGKISMHHALLISKRNVKDLDGVIERIRKEKLSVRKLARVLTGKRRGRKPVYFRKGEDGGFRLSPIRISKDTPEDVRADMIEALKSALTALEASPTASGTTA